MANAEDLKKLTKSTACPNGDLTHANLRGVDLKGAQLRGANSVSYTHLRAHETQ